MIKARHLDKASHNEDFFKSLDINKTKFTDWIVNGIFYAAHHYLDAYFSGLNKHSSSHDILDDWIEKDNKISCIYLDYRELKQYRWRATYKSTNFTPVEIIEAILPKFHNVKKQIYSILNS